MGLINKVDMVCLSPVGYGVKTIFHRRQTYHINLVDQTHIQRTRPRRKTVFFKTTLRVFITTNGCVVYSSEFEGMFLHSYRLFLTVILAMISPTDCWSSCIPANHHLNWLNTSTRSLWFEVAYVGEGENSRLDLELRATRFFYKN